MDTLAEPLNSALLFCALSFGGATLLLLIQHLTNRSKVDNYFLVGLHAYAAPAVLATVIGGDGWLVVAYAAVSLISFWLAYPALRNFTNAGRALLVTHALFICVGIIWGLWFISTIPVGTTTRMLMIVGYSLLVWVAVTGFIQNFEQWEVLCRKVWRRPRSPLRPEVLTATPKVSIHVPVCSEPPEIVVSTLNSLARLRYPNFEVLVLDNNTLDRSLWQPVEEHCRRLGERFRFFHIEQLSGAKAGALNFALGKTSPDAEIIAVIDSDDQAQADFLESLVGHFEDPQIGFVQVAQDSRETDRSLYLTMRYAAHKAFWLTTMVSRNERDGGLIAGTFALIRRRALVAVGGWAEWCLTEDSELSIRLHAIGYSGVYVADTFGRGLIPERFSALKRQYFRWTYGPVQELKRHWRLYLPWPFAHPSHLTPAQKMHHLNHGLERLNLALRTLLIPLGAALMVSMAVNREVVYVPRDLSVAALVFVFAGFAYWYLVYRVVVRASFRHMLAALFVSRAISHTTGIASLTGAITRKAPWHRTDKSEGVPSGLRAAWDARSELLLGICCLLFAASVFLLLPKPGLLLFFVVGAVDQSFTYLTAPALALIADRGLIRRQPYVVGTSVASLVTAAPEAVAAADGRREGLH